MRAGTNQRFVVTVANRNGDVFAERTFRSAQDADEWAVATLAMSPGLIVEVFADGERIEW